MMKAAAILVIAAAMALPLYTWARYQQASRDVENVHARVEQVMRDIHKIRDLREAQEVIADRKRPEQDVIARVNACLASAGIASDRFAGLRPEADVALTPVVGQHVGGVGGGRGHRRQSVLITLNDLTVSDIGAFLRDWVKTNPLWTPTRLELLHGRDADRSDRYSLNLQLSSTYLAAPHSSEPSP